MKKRILGVVIIAAVALAAGWNFNQSENEVELSDLALANVEALANGEIGLPGYENVILEWEGGMGGGWQKKCWEPGRRIC